MTPEINDTGERHNWKYRAKFGYLGNAQLGSLPAYEVEGKE